MIISGIRLLNFRCYRGEHVIEGLGSNAYAICAHDEDDPERSNGVGKSSLFWAIDLALNGTHKARVDDDLITEGESSTEIDLTLDDGHRIKWSKGRGKAKRIYLFPPGERDKHLLNDEATRAIRDLVGLGTDFRMTCYFEQKKLSNFLDIDPSARMDIVSGWFGLERIQAAEAEARRRVSEAEKEAARITGHVSALQKQLEEVTQRRAEVGDRKVIEERHAAIKERLELARTELAEAREAEKLARARARHAQVVQDGKALKAEIAGMVQRSDEEMAAARKLESEYRAESIRLRREANERCALVTEGFDGKCPVMGEECPVANQVGANVDQFTALANDVKKEAQAAHEKWDATKNVLKQMEHEHGMYVRKNERLIALRNEERALRPYAEHHAEDVDTSRAQLEVSRLSDELAEEARMLAIVDDVTKREHKIRSDIEAWTETAKVHAERVRVLRAAAQIFGRNGAQRRLAEGNLVSIEREANDCLAAVNAGTEVRLSWSREGGGLAKYCDACGAAFPGTAKVKACTTCGAERGPLIVHKFEVELSKASGGLEDIAGAAIQLAASRWLRAARGANWEAALVDEPFGALDASRRRAFAAQLPRMFRAAGFRQMFVIAHHAQILDSMPARIEITGKANGSTMRLVA